MPALYPLRRRSPFAPYDPNDPQASVEDQGSMYGPTAAPPPPPPPQQGPPSMFTPAPTGPMPDFSRSTPDVSQSTPIDMNAMPKIPEAPSMYQPAPQPTPEQPQQPQSIYEKYGVRPPQSRPMPKEPILSAPGTYGHMISAWQAQDESERRRAAAEVEAAQRSEQIGQQAGFYKNVSRLATPYKVEGPDGPHMQTHDLVTGKVVDLGLATSKDVPAKYVRSVEVVDGKPMVVWVNDNDPTDRKLGGPAAPHEFAPERTQIMFTPTGQPLATKGATISQPTWVGPPLPEAGGQPPPAGGAEPSGAPSPAPSSAAGQLPPGPYLKPGSGSQVSQDEVKLIADAIQEHKRPPTTTGLGRSGVAAKVGAELQRRGFDLAAAETDWKAAQRYFASANATPQLRMRQAVSTARNSLGLIEQFAKQWDAGPFPPLNKASLALAKNGVYGPEAQKIATNLDVQIIDVASELGQIYMGGNTPTDHSLEMAQKTLASDWAKGQLLSAVALARENLTIRENSILTAGPLGLSGTENVYTPPREAGATGGGSQKTPQTPIYDKAKGEWISEAEARRRQGAGR